MAGLIPGPTRGGLTGENTVYTALLIIAAVFVIAATICLAYQFHSFYGLENLFGGTAELGK